MLMIKSFLPLSDYKTKNIYKLKCEKCDWLKNNIFNSNTTKCNLIASTIMPTSINKHFNFYNALTNKLQHINIATKSPFKFITFVSISFITFCLYYYM